MDYSTKYCYCHLFNFKLVGVTFMGLPRISHFLARNKTNSNDFAQKRLQYLNRPISSLYSRPNFKAIIGFMVAPPAPL